MLPVAFHLGPVAVYTYTLAFAVAFVAGWAVVRLASPRLGLPMHAAGDLSLAAFLGGIIGARAWYVATFPAQLGGVWLRAFELQQGGLVFYGGVAGGALALPLAGAIGRLGCFSAGCCGGRVTTGLLGVVFPGSSAAALPAQLIDAAAQLALFGVLLMVFVRVAAARGLVAWAWLALYPVARFLVGLVAFTRRERACP